MIPLLIRADADAQIGAGHLMRCLALAQVCCDQGGTAAFACARIEPALRERLRSEGLTVHQIQAEPGSPNDAAQVIALAAQFGARWVVADGYVFGAAYQQAIKKSDSRLLVVDDYGHADQYYADVILNPNSSADVALYPNRKEGTQLLLGLRYVLLRREFEAWQGWKRAVPEIGRKLLVTLGGGAHDALLRRIMLAIAQSAADGMEVRVLCAGSGAEFVALQDAVRTGPVPVELRSFAANMPELLAWADLAIAGGGSNTWERAFLSLPTAIVVLADNQRASAAFCASQGIALNLGEHQAVTIADLIRALGVLVPAQARRAEMARRGAHLVDGLGAARVLACLADYPVRLRQLRADDCRRVWEWANDPAIRAVSFSADPIPWEHHQRWFTARLQDPASVFFIATTECNEPIGQVHFDVKGAEAVISVSLAPDARGKGYGPMVIRKASRELFSRGGVDVIHAYIKTTNEASCRAFAKAGYAASMPTVVAGHRAEHMVLQR